MTETTLNGSPSIRLKYTKGRTINMGNFESVRVDIGIEIDCSNMEEIPPTFARMKEWVDKKIQAELERSRQ